MESLFYRTMQRAQGENEVISTHMHRDQRFYRKATRLLTTNHKEGDYSSIYLPNTIIHIKNLKNKQLSLSLPCYGNV